MLGLVSACGLLLPPRPSTVRGPWVSLALSTCFLAVPLRPALILTLPQVSRPCLKSWGQREADSKKGGGGRWREGRHTGRGRNSLQVAPRSWGIDLGRGSTLCEVDLFVREESFVKTGARQKSGGWWFLPQATDEQAAVSFSTLSLSIDSGHKKWQEKGRSKLVKTQPTRLWVWY